MRLNCLHRKAYCIYLTEQNRGGWEAARGVAQFSVIEEMISPTATDSFILSYVNIRNPQSSKRRNFSASSEYYILIPFLHIIKGITFQKLVGFTRAKVSVKVSLRPA
jgi:hypothetical protein